MFEVRGASQGITLPERTQYTKVRREKVRQWEQPAKRVWHFKNLIISIV